MKTLLAFCFLLLAVSARAQIVFIPGTTNTATVIMRPTTNNTVTVEASTAGDSGTSVGVELPVVAGILTSNTWSLYNATNGMKAGDFRLMNSNGVAAVYVWMSNSVPVIKQIAP